MRLQRIEELEKEIACCEHSNVQLKSMASNQEKKIKSLEYYITNQRKEISKALNLFASSNDVGHHELHPRHLHPACTIPHPIKQRDLNLASLTRELSPKEMIDVRKSLQEWSSPIKCEDGRKYNRLESVDLEIAQLDAEIKKAKGTCF